MIAAQRAHPSDGERADPDAARRSEAAGIGGPLPGPAIEFHQRPGTRPGRALGTALLARHGTRNARLRAAPGSSGKRHAHKSAAKNPGSFIRPSSTASVNAEWSRHGMDGFPAGRMKHMMTALFLLLPAFASADPRSAPVGAAGELCLPAQLLRSIAYVGTSTSCSTPAPPRQGSFPWRRAGVRWRTAGNGKDAQEAAVASLGQPHIAPGGIDRPERRPATP